jgi:DNA-binding CsgD family transcriptional regulator/tetratricopeptide (TPR) repeat protein
MIGREVEMARLRDHLGAADAGQGAVVVVSGEAGSGKTRLLAEFAAEARASASFVLRGRATEVGGSPYRALGEALVGAARLGVSMDTPALTPFQSALGQLVPQWRSPGFVVSAESPVVIGEAVGQLLGALASKRPALLALEDVHWADPDTLAILEYLADNIEATRALCVVSSRSGVKSRGTEVLDSLYARRVVDRIELRRLDDESMHALVGSILGGDTGDATRVAISRADGLPFMLEEVLDAAAGAGELVQGASGWEWRREPSTLPASVTDAVQQKLDALAAHGRRIVAAAALCGASADTELIAAALCIDERDVVVALREAVIMELMTDTGATMQFRHALSREAVITGTPLSERRELARELALGKEGSDAQLAASLFSIAGDDPAAARSLVAAGRAALESGAVATAIALAESAAALREVPLANRCDIDDVLSQALVVSGRWERVFEVGNRLLASLVEIDAPTADRVPIYLRLSRAALAASMWQLAASHSRTARELAVQSQSADRLPLVDVLDAAIAIESGNVGDAERFATSALTAGERMNLPEVVCESLEVLGRVERLRDATAAERIFGRAADVAEEHALALWQIRALHELGIAEMFRGEHANLERTRSLAISAGMLSVAVDVDHQLAGLHVFLLEPDALIEAAGQALTGARQLHLDAAAAVAHIHLATGHAMRGRRDEAEKQISSALELSPDLPDIAIFGWAQGRALGSLLQEQRARAREELDRAMELALAHPSVPPAAHRVLWPIVHALDDGDASAVDTIRPLAGASMLTRAFVAYADAILHGRRGEGAAALASVEEGDEYAKHWTGFRDLGRRLVAEAALRDRWGDPVPWLRELVVRFTDLGFPHVAAACRALLRDAGAPVPRPRVGAPAVPPGLARLGVTGRELEVAALLRDGLTNAEMADRLVLSVRTVEKHLDNLRAKTGAGTRRELARIVT